MRHRGDSEGRSWQAAPPAVFRGCRLARGRSAPRRLPRAFGAPPASTRMHAVLATARSGPFRRQGHKRAWWRQFQSLPPAKPQILAVRHLPLRAAYALHVTSCACKQQSCAHGGSVQTIERRIPVRLRVARPRLDEVLRCCQKSQSLAKERRVDDNTLRNQFSIAVRVVLARVVGSLRPSVQMCASDRRSRTAGLCDGRQRSRQRTIDALRRDGRRGPRREEEARAQAAEAVPLRALRPSRKRATSASSGPSRPPRGRRRTSLPYNLR